MPSNAPWPEVVTLVIRMDIGGKPQDLAGQGGRNAWIRTVRPLSHRSAKAMSSKPSLNALDKARLEGKEILSLEAYTWRLTHYKLGALDPRLANCYCSELEAARKGAKYSVELGTLNAVVRSQKTTSGAMNVRVSDLRRAATVFRSSKKG